MVRDNSGVNHVNTISTITTGYYQDYQKMKKPSLPKTIVNRNSVKPFTHMLVTGSNQQLIELPNLESRYIRERNRDSEHVSSPAQSNYSLSLNEPQTCVSDSELTVDNKITNSEFKIVQGNTLTKFHI